MANSVKKTKKVNKYSELELINEEDDEIEKAEEEGDE